MMRNLLIATLLAALTWSCQPQVEVPKSLLHNLDSVVFQTQIRGKIERFEVEESPEADGVRIYASRFMRSLYERNDFLPLWKDRNAYNTYLRVLKDIRLDGLLQQDYNFDKIGELYQQLDSVGITNHELVTNLDVLTTNSFLLLSLHLAEGKSEPTLIDPNWNYDFFKDDPGSVDTVYQYLSTDRVIGFLDIIRGRSDFYLEMKKTLMCLYNIKEAGGWDSIDFSENRKLELGDTSKVIGAIRQRLIASGELLPDSSLNIDYYDKSLFEAVKQFQLGHGLVADGIIGMGTITALNYPVEHKIDKVRVNMERARWLTSELSEKLLVVNIANFSAYLLRKDSILYSSKVVVGKFFTKTPVFEGKLAYVEFNPTWTIPNSILYKSTIPAMRRDPEYLEKHNMKLLNYQGEEIAVSDVDLNASGFPYLVRQGPGPRNALGRVKFIFPNKHSVYLHDTPSRYLFGKNERAFSHGCIRVDQPMIWAQTLLDNEVDQEGIRKIIAKGDTKRMYPADKIRIMILYLTHITDRARGGAFYYEDIYDRDQRILAVLDAPIDEQIVALKDRMTSE